MRSPDREGAIDERLERPALGAALWSGWTAFSIATLLATVAHVAVPHTRGIGFSPTLRLTVVGSACLVAAMVAALAYRACVGHVARPRRWLAGGLTLSALLLVSAIALAGSGQVAITAAPAIICAAGAILWRVPRSTQRSRRSRLGATVFVVLGAVELLGVVVALSGETSSPPGVQGLAFDVPRAAFDVDHKFLELDGARIHYVDEGVGETLLFLHGNPAWSFQWRELIVGLRGSYRCVALDYPGFGSSTAPAGFGYTPGEQSRVVEAFAERLGLRELTLVMQDWGGPIGFAFAVRRPELVRAFILGSTWAWPTATSEPRGMWSVIAGGPVGEFAQLNFNSVASAGIRSSFVRAPKREELELYERPFQPLERRGIAAFYPAQITAARSWFEQLERSLPKVADKRALIFWALADPGFPRDDLIRWERALPQHETVELPNTSHFFFEDASARVVAEIRSFMSSRAVAADRQ
jgi:pimeloyl-ACP methyl ester carboxylesterase